MLVSQKDWELQVVLSSVCFTCSSKGHASGPSLVVFRFLLFAAEKPSPMCTRPVAGGGAGGFDSPPP